MLKVSIILNRNELSTSSLRSDALDILESGLEAINTEKILKSKITLENGGITDVVLGKDGAICIENTGFQCNFYERIFFIGIGKCAYDGAKVIEDILGDRLTDGIVIDVKSGVLKKIKSYEGTHPYPSLRNVTITKQILEMVEDVTDRDLVLVLISGGGSSLLCLPHEINCETLVRITKSLTEKGADIFELNTVRKHLSEIQGGGLAKILYPAQVVSLIFSDVLGNDIGMVASGPTVYDETTAADAVQILRKYDLLEKEILPDFEILETPKDPKYFLNVKNVLVSSNHDALNAMKLKAESLGYKSEIISDKISGNATKVGEEIANKSLESKSCMLFGGETTVHVKGSGKGGRNQELVLSAMPHIKEGTLVLSASSDGWDNTEHAGAIADLELLEKSKQMGIFGDQYLENNDSFNFFKQVGGAIQTGRLGSNVSDLFFIIKN